MFTCREVLPGIRHITDAMGVSFTLITGKDRALLLDTGYGLEDVSALVRSLTALPVEVVLTHGHHDHALGARWFSSVRMFPEDLEVYRLRTGREQREKVLAQAKAKGLEAPADFLSFPFHDPEPLAPEGSLGRFPCLRCDLGGREVFLLLVPAHTPGSLVAYVPDQRLLLTGDDWNPCTWVWFPESLSVYTWHQNMQDLLPALAQAFGTGIVHVLCSHQPNLRPASELEEYLRFMSPERLESAPPVEMNSPIRTRQAADPDRDWVLIFDADKA